MAAKKATGGKSMTKWDEELAKRAAIAMGMEEASLGGGNFVSTRAGVLKYRDNPVPGNKMNVIILDHIFENDWYEHEFDADNPANPDCFALGKSAATLAPHENATQPQHPKCQDCPLGGKEAWGTSDKGRGKACKNTRRLIMITEDALKDIENAQAAMIKIPVTSVKAWAGYVKSLTDTLKRPALGVVTEISLVPDTKSQFKMQFKLKENVPNEHLDALFKKADAVQATLMQPYQPMDEDERGGKSRAKSGGKAGAKAGAKASRKAPARKAGRGR